MQGEGMNAIDVTFRTEISIENKSTEQLTAEVNVRYRQAEQLAGMSAMMLADAGRRLIEIKARIPHGQFETWCADNLEFSKSKAEKMMKLAERVADENSLFSKTETFTDIGISRVWALLAAPEEVAAEVIETNDVESMTVRELKAELARVKEEKEAAERKAEMIDHNNDDIRKELASMQRKLSETVSEEEFAQMQEDYERRVKALGEELNQVEDDKAGVQAKLDKAKEDLKKLKAKQKEFETAKDEEIQKRVAEAGAEREAEIRADAQKEAETALKEKAEAIQALEQHISKLEADNAKLSNTTIMEFKVLADQLQDVYWKINEVISNEEDDQLQEQLRGALQKLVEGWRP
jgi:hypothetical protein